jgi:hypothetical protein
LGRRGALAHVRAGYRLLATPEGGSEMFAMTKASDAHVFNIFLADISHTSCHHVLAPLRRNRACPSTP